ncbi:MAG: hypothetical protein E7C36_02730 [Mixta calida]|uniref:hypothetical protein n=1 Tax=Mixta calida TaxID=665913 RepID=UPI0028A7A2BF|nr:hypothetical protein [Mixta calida]MDU2732203.1 hypothetical protein [Mixta calida]MDU3816784.1 hypothetical protein [Pantoea sp.]MDU6536810.1 hypothetical protein [Mixta calida]
MNMFCKVDEEGFPHWNGVDFMRFWFLPNNQRFLTGENYLWAYKAAWLVYNKSRVIKIAQEEKIPAILLAGVAIAEAGVLWQTYCRKKETLKRILGQGK